MLVDMSDMKTRYAIAFKPYPHSDEEWFDYKRKPGRFTRKYQMARSFSTEKRTRDFAQKRGYQMYDIKRIFFLENPFVRI